MSVCVEQTNFKRNHLSQNYTVCDESSKFFLFKSKIKGYAQKIKIWKDRSQQRKALAKLDDRLLADIGYSTVQAAEEFSKPFWK